MTLALAIETRVSLISRFCAVAVCPASQGDASLQLKGKPSSLTTHPDKVTCLEAVLFCALSGRGSCHTAYSTCPLLAIRGAAALLADGNVFPVRELAIGFSCRQICI
ncbi:hypothetical protein XELAEV_18016625mg [Xenopus laevis]|uniref:Uncharacterized protein n=1 Tax=Xenopus laevis TaxID=8355 RepID=A0A974HRU6_XENLA|nr:hypothetical protein XELAEV_18016625mg [Xenopus laevis]